MTLVMCQAISKQHRHNNGYTPCWPVRLGIPWLFHYFHLKAAGTRVPATITEPGPLYELSEWPLLAESRRMFESEIKSIKFLLERERRIESR